MPPHYRRATIRIRPHLSPLPSGWPSHFTASHITLTSATAKVKTRGTLVQPPPLPFAQSPRTLLVDHQLLRQKAPSPRQVRILPPLHSFAPPPPEKFEYRNITRLSSSSASIVVYKWWAAPPTPFPPQAILLTALFHLHATTILHFSQPPTPRTATVTSCNSALSCPPRRQSFSRDFVTWQ